MTELLIHSGQSLQEFESLTALHRRYNERREHAALVPELSAAFADARKKMELHAAETRRLEEQRKAEYTRLIEATEHARGELASVEKAKADLECLELSEHEALGLERPNLDHYTLTHGGTTVNRLDESAPRRAVDAATFDRENSKRCELVNDARRKVEAEYGRACTKWKEGGWVGRQPVCPPLPTWRDIVAQL